LARPLWRVRVTPVVRPVAPASGPRVSGGRCMSFCPHCGGGRLAARAPIARAALVYCGFSPRWVRGPGHGPCKRPLAASRRLIDPILCARAIVRCQPLAWPGNRSPKHMTAPLKRPQKRDMQHPSYPHCGRANEAATAYSSVRTRWGCPSQDFPHDAAADSRRIPVTSHHRRDANAQPPYARQSRNKVCQSGGRRRPHRALNLLLFGTIDESVRAGLQKRVSPILIVQLEKRLSRNRGRSPRVSCGKTTPEPPRDRAVLTPRRRAADREKRSSPRYEAISRDSLLCS